VSNSVIIFREPLALTVPGQVSVVGPTGCLEFVSSNLDCAPAMLNVRDGKLNMTVRNFSYGGSSLSVNGGQLTISGQNLDFGTGDVTLSNSAQLAVSGANVILQQNMILLTGTAFHVFAVFTNGANTNITTVVNVGGEIRVGVGAWVYPHSESNSGGSIWFRARGVSIAPNAGFNARGLGFAGGIGQSDPGWYGRGPGGGKINSNGAGGGGAHGGQGGTCRSGNLHQPATYDSSNAPVWAGSGGGSGYNQYVGGGGGGVIRIDAAKGITVDGTLDARGQNDPNGQQHAGGGAGGSIYLRCVRFGGGAAGQLLADGGSCGTVTGNSQGGAGGGGRIAIYRAIDTFSGVTSATNGLGGYGSDATQWGTPGTVVWRSVPAPWTLIQIR
jgi:hypothetical protein